MTTNEKLLHQVLELLGDTIVWHYQGDPNANIPSTNALRVVLYHLAVRHHTLKLTPPTKRDLQALRLTAEEWTDAMNEILDAGVIEIAPPNARFKVLHDDHPDTHDATAKLTNEPKAEANTL